MRFAAATIPTPPSTTVASSSTARSRRCYHHSRENLRQSRHRPSRASFSGNSSKRRVHRHLALERQQTNARTMTTKTRLASLKDGGDRDSNEDAIELLTMLRAMIANRQKFPELRKKCVQFFEQKMLEKEKEENDKYSIPPRICLDCVEILEEERREREMEMHESFERDDDEEEEEEEEEEDEFYDRNWGQEESYDEDVERAPSAKEIESERILLQFVIIESCSRADGVREAYTRNWFELKNITRSRVKCEESRRRAANLVYFAAKERGGGAQQARVIARIAESFGVRKEDFFWGEETNDIVTAKVIEDYVEYLLEEAPGSACATITHFELEKFTNSETFELLANRDEIGLLEELVKNLSREKKIEFVATCLAQDSHSFLRAGFRFVKRFNLYEEFPDIKKQYWESSIDRMVSKGAFEAALKHAGDDVHFQERVVSALVAAGELEYARTFAERCGFSESDIASICSDEMMMQMRRDRELRYYKLPENVNVSFVDDESSLKEMYRVLSTSSSIGIDTEWAAKLGGDAEDSENEKEEEEDREEEETTNAGAPPSKRARGGALSETVALLQISSKEDCFLLDLPKLIDDVPSAILKDTLGALFSNDSILKLVFAGKEDFKRLSQCASYLGQPKNVLDLQQYWRTRVEGARQMKMKKNNNQQEQEQEREREESQREPWLLEKELNRHQPIGLSNLCSVLLSKPLDKSARMSDWSSRPLSHAQRVYAALDAQVLVDCHQILLKYEANAKLL